MLLINHWVFIFVFVHSKYFSSIMFLRGHCVFSGLCCCFILLLGRLPDVALLFVLLPSVLVMFICWVETAFKVTNCEKWYATGDPKTTSISNCPIFVAVGSCDGQRKLIQIDLHQSKPTFVFVFFLICRGDSHYIYTHANTKIWPFIWDPTGENEGVGC